MRNKEIAYYLYFIACFATILAVIIENDLLLLIVKPIIVPSIYYYYLVKTKKANVLYTLILLFIFIGDAITLLGIKDLLLIMVPFYISYLLTIVFLVADIQKVNYNFRNLFFSLMVLAVLLLMVYLILDIQTVDGQKLIIPFSIYGVTLSIMVTLSVYNYLSYKEIAGFYLLIGCGGCLVSDVFYFMYTEHFHLPILNYINAATHALTTIFLVKYMLKRRPAANLKNAS